MAENQSNENRELAEGQAPKNAPPAAGDAELELAVAQVAEQAKAGPPALEEPQPKKPKKKNFFLRHKKLCITLGVLAVLGVGIGVWWNGQVQKVKQVMNAMTGQTTAQVERRDITVSLSGSGTLQAADSYTITSLVEGEILAADFEEGDVVEKDAVLYEVDSSDLNSTIEQAELSLAQSQRNYNRTLRGQDDLNIKAAEGGSLVSLEVEAGDEVSAGQLLATLRNDSVMSLTLPFAADDALLIKEGQKAVVTVDGTFEQVAGTVSKVTAVDDILTGNMLVRQVTIDVENPGGISAGQAATAVIGKAACAQGGTFAYKGEAQLMAPVSGKVASIAVQEGAFLQKDQVVMTLSSEDMADSLEDAASSIKNAEISLNNQRDRLEDFTIKSPISGTIIEKYFKAGDKMETGKTLCTIFDLSYLTMTLNIDELDISQIEVGQKVEVTAEAVPGKVYEGVVTKVNIKGTTQNGVTSYPVTVRIDETDGLLPGMNVDAVIVVQHKENVLSVPVSAVGRGNQVRLKTGAEGAEDEFTPTPVETGVSDEDYIEIVSGLSEGDEVAYTPNRGIGGDLLYFGMGDGIVVTFSYCVEEPAGGGPGGGPGGPGGGF